MNIPRHLTCGAALTLFAALPCLAEPSAAQISAQDVAAKLSAGRDGSTYVRLKMGIHPSDGKVRTLQIQIKERRSKGSADVVYQVLWPKERKGEGFLLRQSADAAPTGFLRSSSGQASPIGAAQLTEPLLGSDLALADAIEDFFSWKSQAITGKEVLDGAECVILESKPEGESSIYGSVRSWVDVRRMVPLRVEKYSRSGKLARRIETTLVATDGSRGKIPANLSVRARPGSTTELDGSRIRHDVKFDDREFTSEGLANVALPRVASE
jgi:outer membrane lipoprotein-sorting protein